MTNNLYIPLPHRAIIQINGKDRLTFLQGLLTNDLNHISDEQAIYALMLTPQGKYLYDFFITQKDEHYFLDCALIHKEAILAKLNMYKLRSAVSINDVSSTFESVALLGEAVLDKIDQPQAGAVLHFCKGIAYIDPRRSELYGRAIIEKENHYQSFIAHDFALGDVESYEAHRIELGIPDGDHDMVSGESFPLDFGMDQLAAIDFNKGCYVGQEVTARVHHRGHLRKRIFRVTSDSQDLPEAGQDVLLEDGSKIGILCSSIDTQGLALLKHESVSQSPQPARIGDITVKVWSGKVEQV